FNLKANCLVRGTTGWQERNNSTERRLSTETCLRRTSYLGPRLPCKPYSRLHGRSQECLFQFLYRVKGGRERKCLRAGFTNILRARKVSSLRLVARRYPPSCWKANCSVTKRGHLPGPTMRSPAGWNGPTKVRCSCMTFPSSSCDCRESCFISYRTGLFAALGTTSTERSKRV